MYPPVGAGQDGSLNHARRESTLRLWLNREEGPSKGDQEKAGRQGGPQSDMTGVFLRRPSTSLREKPRKKPNLRIP